MNKKTNRLLFWIPRVLSICFILFLALFSLDVFGNGYGFWGTALGLFMHNLPSLVLLAVLIVAWKHEIVGGIAFILGGFLYMALLFRTPDFEWFYLTWSMIIAGPAFLIGALFLIGWSKKKKAIKH